MRYLRDSIIYHPVFALSVSIIAFYGIPYFFYGSGRYLSQDNWQIWYIIFSYWSCFSLPFIFEALRKRNHIKSTNIYVGGSALYRLVFPLALLACSNIEIPGIPQITFYLSFTYAVYISILFFKRNLHIWDKLLFFTLILDSVASGDKSNSIILILPTVIIILATGKKVRVILWSGLFTSIVFYSSAIFRSHNLTLQELSIPELIFRLIVGRLNLVEPFLRILNDADRFDNVVSGYLGGNTIFPNVVIGLVPRALINRSDVSPAIKFSEVYYGGNTNVTMSAFAEIYANFNFFGCIYYLVFGCISFYFHRLMKKKNSRVIYCFYVFFLIYALFLHVERYQALMLVTLFKSFIFIYLALMLQRLTFRFHHQKLY